MSTHNKRFSVQRTISTFALLLAFGPAIAQDAAEIEKMTKPDSSSITVGVSGVSGKKEDRANFGQYNGFRKNSGQLDLDVDYLKREESTGTWTTMSGRNLGNENREFGFAQQKQGDWKYSFEYGELVRNYTNTINTALQGIGTTNLTVTSLGNTAAGTAAALAAGQGTGTNVDLKTTRKALGLGAETWLTPSLLFEANFKSETKTGARMFGKFAPCNATAITAKDGYGCAAGGAQVGNGAVSTATMSALLMLPEPINSTTRQFEAKLNYSDDKLLLSGAYYGSFYTNSYGSMTTTFAGSLWNPNGGSFNPAVVGGNGLAAVGAGGGVLALPPDNQSHQLSLGGTYAITPTTRATFKYAYTHGTQKENFESMGMTGAPRGALDGVIDTTTAQFGLTARPMPKLSLLANLRYEQKSDKTPIDQYVKNATTGATTFTGKTNSPGSHTKIAAKFEASYQLPSNYRVTGGVDIDMRDLGRPTGTNDASQQASAIRAKTQEIGYRGELRKSFADNFSGALSATHSFRNGSTWMNPGAGGITNSATPMVSSTQPDGVFQAASGFGLFPMISMDLKRDKLKASSDWAASESLSLQASADVSADHYFAPTMRGIRDGKTSNVNFDATYKLSENWKMNGWYSRGDTILDINGGSGGYMAGMRQLGHNLGLGVRGAPTGKLELGADFTFSYEVNRTGVGTTGNGLGNAVPTAAFRQLNLNLFSKYALDKNTDIKVNLAHQRYYSNEWFWNNNGTSFFYSDGTTVTQKDQQNVTFIGAAYIYKFQ
jgi:MtrB/PioB family decaheme-associated outer membrane protein